MKKILLIVLLFINTLSFGQTIRLSQIEPIQGTVIKSTGETANKILTTNGSGGATWQSQLSIADYIQNQNDAAQTANMWISGTIKSNGIIHSNSASGWAIGSIADVPRIDYTSNQFRALNAANTFTGFKGTTFESTVTATAPFIVASSALVSNLNADLLDGYNETDFFRGVGVGVDANSPRLNSSGYSYAVNTPTTGSILTFGIGNYQAQIQASASSTDILTYRSQIGGTWGNWRYLYHDGNSNLTSVNWSSNINNSLQYNLNGFDINTANTLTNIAYKSALSNGTIPKYATTGTQLVNSGIIDNGSVITLDKKTEINGYHTNDYKFRVGSFILQPYALNNAFVAENAYYSITGWKRISAGYAEWFQLYNGTFQVALANTGSVGSAVTKKTPFKVEYNGAVALGGDIHYTTGNYSGSVMLINASGNVGINTVLPSERLEVNGNAKIGGKTTTGTFQMTVGAFDGYIMKSDASGNGSWAAMSLSETDPVFTAHTTENIIDGTGFLKNNGSGTWTFDNTTYEPAISGGTGFDYIRGDKTIRQLTTNAVTENTNLYFTDTRARAAVSLTTTGTSGAATYTPATGVFNIPDYTKSINALPQMEGNLIVDTDWFPIYDTSLGTENKVLMSGLKTYFGGTTIGQSVYTSANPSAIRFLRANANNTISWLTAAEFATAIGAGGADAPINANYLVGTSDATLTNEIVVGTTPGGILGGTWASPTLDDASVNYPKISAYNSATDGASLTYSSGVNSLSWNVITGLPSQATHSGKYLTTNGTTASWATVAATPGGSNTHVQYNNSSAFGGELEFTYNSTTNTLDADVVTVNTEVYDRTGWNGDLSVPTKDAVSDKLEAMSTSYDHYYINSTMNLTASTDGYLNIYTNSTTTPGTIYAIVDVHIDHGEGTFAHVSGNFSSGWNGYSILKQTWTSQYYDYLTSTITITPELFDNGTTATFRIKFNSPVTSSHHYVVSVKYLHRDQ